eukprot:4057285-Alexandrium_andersonii.AAC.1
MRGSPLLVFNVYAPPNATRDATARRQTVRLFAGLQEELAQAVRLPHLVLGDFNTELEVIAP